MVVDADQKRVSIEAMVLLDGKLGRVALVRGKTGAAQQSELASLTEDTSSMLGSNVDSSA